MDHLRTELRRKQDAQASLRFFSVAEPVALSAVLRQQHGTRAGPSDEHTVPMHETCAAIGFKAVERANPFGYPNGPL